MSLVVATPAGLVLYGLVAALIDSSLKSQQKNG
jgi:hypothetical protein